MQNVLLIKTEYLYLFHVLINSITSERSFKVKTATKTGKIVENNFYRRENLDARIVRKSAVHLRRRRRLQISQLFLELIPDPGGGSK